MQLKTSSVSRQGVKAVASICISALETWALRDLPLPWQLQW